MCFMSYERLELIYFQMSLIGFVAFVGVSIAAAAADVAVADVADIAVLVFVDIMFREVVEAPTPTEFVFEE